MYINIIPSALTIVHNHPLCVPPATCLFVYIVFIFISVPHAHRCCWPSGPSLSLLFSTTITINDYYTYASSVSYVCFSSARLKKKTLPPHPPHVNTRHDVTRPTTIEYAIYRAIGIIRHTSVPRYRSGKQYRGRYRVRGVPCVSRDRGKPVPRIAEEAK